MTVPNTIEDAIDRFAAEGDVKTRAMGVIACFLHEKYGVDKQQAFRDAPGLIHKMTTAGLLTFIGEDIKAFVRRATEKCSECGFTPSIHTHAEGCSRA